MTAKRKIEVFSAGCPVCQETIELVKRNACQSCDITVLDMNNANVAGLLFCNPFIIDVKIDKIIL